MFKYPLSAEFLVGDETLWVCERMMQEVMSLAVPGTFWINELYLLVPQGKDYTNFLDADDYRYYDVSELEQLEKVEE